VAARLPSVLLFLELLRWRASWLPSNCWRSVCPMPGFFVPGGAAAGAAFAELHRELEEAHC